MAVGRLGRLPPPTGDPRVDAVRELRWTMAGEGLTAHKLSVTPAILGLPAVRAATAGVPESGRLPAAYAAVVAAARGLGDSFPARVLRSALGIDYAGDARNLSGRRQEFASVRDPHTIYYIEQRMLDALVTALGSPSGAPAEDGAAPADRPSVWNVPVLRDPHFVGRDDLLAAVEDSLRGPGAIALTHTLTRAISGLGGIGKTALAAEFAYRHVAGYDVVWWLRAEEPATLARDFAGLAPALGLAVAGTSQADAVAAARSWLTAHDRWLLVFDNAERPDDIAPYLPGLRGHVLVTSRSPHWSSVATVVEVPPLDVASAAELIRRRTGFDDAGAAAALAVKLACIPKVIEVAAATFIQGSGVSLARFSDQLGDGSLATAGVWDAAFDNALETRGAREVLALCSVMDPDDIQVDLLTAASGLPENVVERAAGALRAQQILRVTVDSLAMHRLVQAAARLRLDPAERSRAARGLAAELLRIPAVPDSAGVAAARRMQTHAPYVVEALDGDAAAALLAWYADRLHADGDYAAARSAIERSLAAVPEGDDAAAGPRLHVLARVLGDLGDLVEARRVAELALAATERAWGPGDARTGDCLHTIAWVLGELGDLRGARAAAGRALAVAENVEEPDAAVIGRRLHLLAWLSCEVGDFVPALDLARRALTITEAALGPDHPYIGGRLHLLALALCELGEHGPAREAAERALAVSARALGPEHADVGPRYRMLAWILAELGDAAAAVRAAGRAVAVTGAALGADSPKLGDLLAVQARALAAAGEHRAALAALDRAQALTEAAFGPDHPDVGLQLRVRAAVLAATGDLRGARDAAERSVRIGEAVLGPDHPEVGRRLGLLAGVLRDLREPAARPVARRALAVVEAGLPRSHPDVRRLRRLVDDVAGHENAG